LLHQNLPETAFQSASVSMNIKRSPPPLRFTLILVCLILIIAHLILEKGIELAFEQPPRIEKQQIESARHLLDRVQQMLSSDYALAEPLYTQRIFSMYRNHPSVELLALLDGQGHVVQSTEHDYIQQPANQVIAGFDTATYTKAVTHQHVIVEKSGSGGSINFYAPLPPPKRDGTTDSERIGTLYLSYDLARARHNAMRETLAPINWLSQMAVLILSTGVILYLLNHWIADPLRRIGRIVSRAAKGDMRALTGFSGSSEIAMLGMGVDRLSREMEASKSAVKQAGLELEKRVDQRTQHLEQEIHYHRNLERALRIHEHQMHTVFNTLSEGIALWDAKGRLLYANPGFRKVLGMGNSDKVFDFDVERTRLFNQDGNPLPVAEFPITKTLADFKLRENEVVGVQHLDAEQRWLNINAVPVSEVRGGMVTGIVASAADITQQKLHQIQLEQMAHFDALTGLPNRRLLHDRMLQLVENCRRKGGKLAVCYLDLDGFKQINDRYGHKAGDALLIEAAGRFLRCVRAGDTVARLGGDEFAVLLTNIEDETECESVLKRILDSLSSPFTVAGNSENGISVSAGITLFPADNKDPDTLLRHADQAMYSAKRSGKNCYHWFDRSVEQRLTARHEALRDLTDALRQQQFILHYQPKVSCHDGSIAGVEALLRWQHPVLGTLPPSQFISLVDEHDIALDIGRWVIEEALTQVHAWTRQGYKLPLSVNIFMRQLQQPNFAAQLEEMLNRIGEEERSPLDLEVIESPVLQGIHDFPQLVARCQAMGVGFSLDDFGTGYSTLDQLRRIPAQSVKIDRSFISDLLTCNEDRFLVKAAIGLGRAFGRKIIAEGVNSVEQMRWLRSAGCDEAQGFLFAEPMEPSLFMAWLQQYRPVPGWLDD